MSRFLLHNGLACFVSGMTIALLVALDLLLPQNDIEAATAPHLNGDSKPDLAVANSASNSVSILLNNGGGTFAARVDYGTGSRSYSVAAADLNDDTHLDLAVANFNSSSVSILLNAGVYTEADLSITKSDNPDPVIAGENITYTITIFNNGPSDAENTTLHDNLSAYINNPEYSDDKGTSWNLWTGTLDLDNLTAGDNETILIRGEVASATPAGIISNTAVVSSDTDDTDPNNDNATTDTQVITETDPAIIMTGDSGVVMGTDFKYTLIVTNNGPSDASGVAVTDVLPAEVIYQSSTASTGAYDKNTGVWTVGNLISGEYETLIMVVTANALPDTVITNIAQVTGNETDPININNSASMNTRIGTSVGGDVIGVSKLGILLPWLSLVSFLLVGGVFILIRKRKVS